MYIQITKTDCEKIVNESLHGGVVKNTELEIALAKKCLSIYERLGQIDNERNEYFEAIYSATIKFEKATKGSLKRKIAADLENKRRKLFTQAVKLDQQLKGLVEDGISEIKDSGRDSKA